MKYIKGEKVLPIDKLSEQEFDLIIKKYLLKPRLGTHEIQKFYRLFGLDDPEIAHLPCNENHAHSIYCQDYSNRQAMVVDRLIEEIRRYRLTLKNLETEISES